MRTRSTPPLQKLLAACNRFVPQRMLSMMGARTLQDVRPGQHAQALVHVLFADIQGYTTLTEQQDCTATFDFVNAYLRVMEPVVTRNGGVIDKFIGDAIMALFPGEADDAVQCAVELSAALSQFNGERTQAGLAPISVGIGINSGLVEIGAVGTEHRLQTTVLGDAVNLAARLEAATREYGVQVLIGESVLYAMDGPRPEALRFIDRIRVRGKLRPVSVYEVVTRQDPGYASKVRSRAEFERAVACYHMRRIEQARALLAPLCARGGDPAAQVYLERCEEFLRTGLHRGTGEVDAQVQWSHDYDIDVEQIDEQHREWCRRLHDLLECLHSGRPDGVAGLFAYLFEYIQWHFGEEEALMEAHAYPHRAAHKAEHRHYAQVLRRFGAELADPRSDPLLVTFRANLFLIDWFVNHTTGTDRQLGQFLASRLGQPARADRSVPQAPGDPRAGLNAPASPPAGRSAQPARAAPPGATHPS